MEPSEGTVYNRIGTFNRVKVVETFFHKCLGCGINIVVYEDIDSDEKYESNTDVYHAMRRSEFEKLFATTVKEWDQCRFNEILLEVAKIDANMRYIAKRKMKAEGYNDEPK
jgi:biotin-(acetyl-CoA carboxylase) ligase